MSMNDPLGDLLTRIRNAQMRNKSKVSSPGSKLRESVLEVLKSEGYIRGYTVTEREGRSELDIELKYFEGEPVIREIERVSKPGRRVYTSVKNLPRINNGLGVAIVSTPKGVMADHAARDANVDAEIIDLRTLLPVDIDTIETSVRKTGRCVIVHEATRTGGYGAELSALVQEKCFYHLEAPITRVTGWDTPYPHVLEWAYFPGPKRVAEALRETVEA